MESQMERRFSQVKKTSHSSSYTKNYRPRYEFTICIDVSWKDLEALGGLLMKKNVVVSYEYRKTKPHQMNHVVYDLELVAVIHAIKMWRHYSFGSFLNIGDISHQYEMFFIQHNLNARQKCEKFPY